MSASTPQEAYNSVTAFIVAAASAAPAQKETVLADQAAHLKVRLGLMPVDHSAATDLILRITAPDSPWAEALRSDLSHFIIATCRHTTAAAGPQGSLAPGTPRHAALRIRGAGHSAIRRTTRVAWSAFSRHRESHGRALMADFVQHQREHQ